MGKLMTAAGKDALPKVKSILVSQPKPESEKSPYYEIAKKFNIRIDFRPFIRIDGVPARDFRKYKINPCNFSAVIFNSRNAIDHFFRLCDEMRIKMLQDTKYFCITEAIALYLQKYILYRKRKVFFGNGTDADLMSLLMKYKDADTFLFLCSDVNKKIMPNFLQKNGFKYAKAVIYNTVSSDFSDMKKLDYDMLVFFSPAGVKSLFDNYPNFKQNDIRIGGFGPTTIQAIRDTGLRLDFEAPTPDTPSMTMAIEKYLQKSHA